MQPLVLRKLTDLDYRYKFFVSIVKSDPVKALLCGKRQSALIEMALI